MIISQFFQLFVKIDEKENEKVEISRVRER